MCLFCNRRYQLEISIYVLDSQQSNLLFENLEMQVHCDASIAFPLVVAATFARKVHSSKWTNWIAFGWVWMDSRILLNSPNYHLEHEVYFTCTGIMCKLFRWLGAACHHSSMFTWCCTSWLVAFLLQPIIYWNTDIRFVHPSHLLTKLTNDLFYEHFFFSPESLVCALLCWCTGGILRALIFAIDLRLVFALLRDECWV